MKREYEALSRLVGRNFAVLDDGNSVYLTPKGAVRDQDGKELLPAFPGRARLYERNLKQGGGGTGLPSDVGPYKQMATDGDGQWVPVDRLAWMEGEKVEITWDGNTEGLISVDGADGTAALYKVSDLLLDDTVIKAGVIYFSNGLSVNVDPVWEGAVSEGLITEDIVFLAEMGVVFVRREGVSAFGFTFTETGVYFYAAKSADSVTNYTARFVSDNQTTHPIPSEYLTNARFVVNVTTEDLSSFTADKTMEEVVAAHKAGMSVVAVLSINMSGTISDNVFPFTAYAEQDGNIMLCNFGAISITSGRVVVSALNMTANGVTYESAPLAEKDQ